MKDLARMYKRLKEAADRCAVQMLTFNNHWNEYHNKENNA